jgi:hypothetical protein
MNRTSLNLDVIQIDKPCPVAWESMKGDARTRFCAHCNRHVHDLSAMIRADAVDLICRNAGEMCVRFARGDDGVVRTLDYAPAARGSGLRKWLCLSALLGLGAGVGNYFWQKPAPPPVPVAPAPMLGGAMAWPITPPTSAPAQDGAPKAKIAKTVAPPSRS